jgi:hypothetical protein
MGLLDLIMNHLCRNTGPNNNRFVFTFVDPMNPQNKRCFTVDPSFPGWADVEDYKLQLQQEFEKVSMSLIALCRCRQPGQNTAALLTYVCADLLA